jgi:tetratricopeptide (TPR) repeat protein
MTRATAIALGATLAFAAAMLAAPAARAAMLPRDGGDERDVRTMQVKNPHALELLNQGEARAAAGAIQEAEEIFKQAHTEYVDGAVLWRRDCEMLIELGRRAEAVRACATAMQALRSENNVRAMVSAFVDGPTPPTTAQVTMALAVTALDRHKGMTLRVAAAACDIAERIGDTEMLQRCTEELEGFDVNHPATQKARAVLDAQCPPWRFWLGWGAIAAALAVTLGHWARRTLRGRSRQGSVVAAAAVVLVAASAPRLARADETPAASASAAEASSAAPASSGAPDPNRYGRKWLSKWHIDDQHPDSNIPSEADRDADPLQFGYWVQDLAVKAERASKLGDHLVAARFYEALGKAVPDRAIGYIKACEEYEAGGDLDAAINACGQALLGDGLHVKDYTRFVDLVVSKPGKLSDKEMAALTNVIAHMRETPAGQPFADEVECEVGVRTSNVATLRKCTAALVKSKPDDGKTIVYQWDLAYLDGSPTEARKLLDRAAAAGVAPAQIEKMRAMTAQNSMRLYVRRGGAVLAAGLLAWALVVGLRALAARKRVAQEAAAVKG